jgi:hypothetical protein
MNDTRSCTRCARPYRIYGHYCGDQDLCPGCRRDRAAEIERLEKDGYPPAGRNPLAPWIRSAWPSRRENFMTFMRV